MTRITCSQTYAIIFSCKDISIMKVIMMPIKSLCKNNFLVHTNPVLSHKLFCKTYLKAFSLERDDICIQNGPPVFCKCSTNVSWRSYCLFHVTIQKHTTFLLDIKILQDFYWKTLPWNKVWVSSKIRRNAKFCYDS